MRFLPTSFWRYTRFAVAAVLTTFAGAQVVHLVFQPLQDLPELIKEEERSCGKAKDALER